MNYIFQNNNVIFHSEGRTHRMGKDDIRFDDLMDALEQGDEDRARKIVRSTPQKVALSYTHDEDFKVIAGEAFYKGVKLSNRVVDVLINLLRDELPVERFVLFTKDLYLNPELRSVEQLYSFLEKDELPISEDGCFYAYKGVSEDYFSVHSNTATIVLRGVVENGRIRNKPGDIVEVARSQVDNDANKSCSFGLHVGTFEYASSFGKRVMLVKVRPQDSVSVPHADANKLRVCRYEVVKEIGLSKGYGQTGTAKKLTEPTYDSRRPEEIKADENTPDNKKGDIDEWLVDQLEKRKKWKKGPPTVKEVQKKFKFKRKRDTQTAIEQLGYRVVRGKVQWS